VQQGLLSFFVATTECALIVACCQAAILPFPEAFEVLPGNAIKHQRTDHLLSSPLGLINLHLQSFKCRLCKPWFCWDFLIPSPYLRLVWKCKVKSPAYKFICFGRIELKGQCKWFQLWRILASLAWLAWCHSLHQIQWSTRKSLTQDLLTSNWNQMLLPKMLDNCLQRWHLLFSNDVIAAE